MPTHAPGRNHNIYRFPQETSAGNSAALGSLITAKGTMHGLEVPVNLVGTWQT